MGASRRAEHRRRPHGRGLAIPADSWLLGLAGIYLVVAGIIRLRSDFALPLARRSAVMPLSAIATTLIGVLIVTRWPGSNLVLLGILLGAEMIVRGWAWVGFGVTLRRALERSSSLSNR